MSKVVITRSKLDGLATTISAKSGEPLPLTIAQMDAAVQGISSVDVEMLNVTSNGTYTAPSGTAYNPVTVAVPTPAPSLQSKSVTPSTSQQTVTPDSGYDGLSSVTVGAMPSGTAGTPSATKGSVSNHAVSVTPSVTNTAGYIAGGTKSGTPVTVSASELVSGSTTITENGTVDVTEYASVTVDVPTGGGATNLVHGEFTTQADSGAQSVSIPYAGNGYPIMAYVVVKGGAYARGTDWYDTIHRYAVGVWAMSKSEMSSSPTYDTNDTQNQAVVCVIYKNSTSNAAIYARTSSMEISTYSSYNANNTNVTCVRFNGSDSMSVYVSTSGTGLHHETDYEYFIAYSE